MTAYRVPRNRRSGGGVKGDSQRGLFDIVIQDIAVVAADEHCADRISVYGKALERGVRARDEHAVISFLSINYRFFAVGRGNAGKVNCFCNLDIFGIDAAVDNNRASGGCHRKRLVYRGVDICTYTDIAGGYRGKKCA